MQENVVSIRPFIGAKDYKLSRRFYTDLGFTESVLSPAMSVFKKGVISFYLQDYYVKDWIDNTMVFVEVEDVEAYWKALEALQLTQQYTTVKLIPIRYESWGSECFLHDPSGVLWHFGQFRG